MNNIPFVIIIIIAALFVSGCAGPKTMVVIAPDQEGKVGALSITTSQGETTLNKAYAAAGTDKNGNIEKLTINEQQVKTIFHDALIARPEPPLSFTLYFLEGKDELTSESQKRLADIRKEITRRGSNISEVTVVGHTDRVGKVEFNDLLSLQRSKKVVDELVAIGISGDSIVAAGRGEREQLIPTADEIPEARNRRVEVNVR